MDVILALNTLVLDATRLAERAQRIPLQRLLRYCKTPEIVVRFAYFLYFTEIKGG